MHDVHHTQEELNVLTSFRAHPLAHTTGFILATVPVVAMTADHPMAPMLIPAHHTQEELNVLTSFRAHPLAHTTGFILATVPVVAMTADHPMAPMLITAYLCLGTVPH